MDNDLYPRPVHILVCGLELQTKQPMITAMCVLRMSATTFDGSLRKSRCNFYVWLDKLWKNSNSKNIMKYTQYIKQESIAVKMLAVLTVCVVSLIQLWRSDVQTTKQFLTHLGKQGKNESGWQYWNKSWAQVSYVGTSPNTAKFTFATYQHKTALSSDEISLNSKGTLSWSCDLLFLFGSSVYVVSLLMKTAQ